MMAVPVKLAPDGQSLERGTPAVLFPVRIAGGPLPSPSYLKQQYAVSTDGQRFLINLAFGQGIDFWRAYTRENLSAEAAAAVARCRSLQARPGPPSDFAKRTQSDRYVPGTKPILIKNAKIWTGDKNGTEVVTADILLDKGVIKGIGHTTRKVLNAYRDDIQVIDAKNAWVTPGIVDMHSHMGNFALPGLDGASDGNSPKGLILVRLLLPRSRCSALQLTLSSPGCAV